VDGNKRTGYLAYRLLLLSFDKDLEASQAEKYEFVMKIASGKMKYQEILRWTISHLTSTKK
jgi:death-on-curing protein